jgi:hypothetical protein
MIWLRRRADPVNEPLARQLSETDVQSIRDFCGACHRFPEPSLLPADEWPARIDLMYQLAEQPTKPLTASIPPRELVAWYYRQLAPDRLTLPAGILGEVGSPVAFYRRALHVPDVPAFPGVSYVQFCAFERNDRERLLACDMRHGLVLLFDPVEKNEPQILGKIANPCHAEVVDLDKDGRVDLLIADLGTFFASDALRGTVTWLRRSPQGGFLGARLAPGPGRVADARAGDFDGDGDLDIAAAVFGWRRTGHLMLLERQASNDDETWEPRILDNRTGASHCPICDLNNDGRPDLVVLFSQEHETVVAFLNRGDGSFDRQTIFEADHPLWGSSAIELVDFDRDSDLDVLLVNGDSLDDLLLKPHHGVGWLENRGSFPFVYHRLADLPGAHGAKMGDLDGDGDTDLVACSFLPMIDRNSFQARSLPSVIWLERLGQNRFVRHVLEVGMCWHPTLDLGDFDGDGDLDIAVGNLVVPAKTTDAYDTWIELFENRGRIRSTDE